ncbi:MAG: RNA polymerase sigma factor [Candidatus Hydrogenedentota bacterium]|nr:MAG: RNA polymerase sigma factor [Candidatus Hydrogenedentota bacterium]
MFRLQNEQHLKKKTVSKGRDLDLLKKGNKKEIEKFILDFYPMVQQIVGKKISSTTEVEDHTQEIFLRILEKESLKKFQGQSEGELRSYVIRIAINYMADHFSRLRKTEDKVDYLDFTLPELADKLVSPSNPEKEFLKQMEIENLYNAIRQLPQHLQQLMEYRLLGFNNKEIAAFMNVPHGTINTWAARAFEKLSRIIKE